MKKLKCAVLGATGAAGQQFVEATKDHPWFETTGLYASERSAGKKYCDAASWIEEGEIPEYARDIVVKNVTEIEKDIQQYDVVLSALPSDLAKIVEEKCAKEKPVISTASAYRYDADVPVLVPEVNYGHIPLIEQQKKRGWKGFVVPGPNCTTVGLVVSLKPIIDEFGIKNVFMTSLQALSGAGYPGVPSLDILDNVIPFIGGEEGKVEKETLKILGKINSEGVENAPLKVSCTCTRVHVKDGHMETVFVETEKPCSAEGYKAAIAKFNEKCRKEFGDLPSYPKDAEAIVVKEEENRPQPKRDRSIGDGMSTIVGRIRSDQIFSNGIKYVVLSHNTKKGAAKGGMLGLEYLVKKGYVK
ncbi:aspartate-semialdehyde dehydrogenase [Candidatus Micrarchaeota archaeon]|nr:aspartate-semialdehyde dehydrogenase [Candidatus Micrarchaeota archaeon]